LSLAIDAGDIPAKPAPRREHPVARNEYTNWITADSRADGAGSLGISNLLPYFCIARDRAGRYALERGPDLILERSTLSSERQVEIETPASKVFLELTCRLPQDRVVWMVLPAGRDTRKVTVALDVQAGDSLAVCTYREFTYRRLDNVV